METTRPLRWTPTRTANKRQWRPHVVRAQSRPAIPGISGDPLVGVGVQLLTAWRNRCAALASGCRPSVPRSPPGPHQPSYACTDQVVACLTTGMSKQHVRAAGGPLNPETAATATANVESKLTTGFGRLYINTIPLNKFRMMFSCLYHV